MHCSIMLALGALLTAIQVDAPPEKTSEPSSSFAAEFAELEAAMDDLYVETQKRYASAKTPEEKEEAFARMLETFATEGPALADKALALVVSRPNDPMAAEVLTWILSFYVSFGAQTKAADLLIEHHLMDPRTHDIASTLARQPMAWSEKVLRALVSADLPRDKQAQAHFQLAQCIKVKASMPALLGTLDPKTQRMVELRYGEEYLAEFAALDSEILEKEAVRLFTEVAEKYGDEKYGIKTLADYASSAIYEIQYLGIGKTAPEISGEDIDGVAMSLNDYRGKVVMLDFWGHW